MAFGVHLLSSRNFECVHFPDMSATVHPRQKFLNDVDTLTGCVLLFQRMFPYGEVFEELFNTLSQKLTNLSTRAMELPDLLVDYQMTHDRLYRLLMTASCMNLLIRKLKETQDLEPSTLTLAELSRLYTLHD